MREFQSHESSRITSKTWTTSRTWPPSSWRVFIKSIRTNNEMRAGTFGWIAAKPESPQLPLYLLISLLHREARRTSGSGTTRRRSSPYGMSLTPGTAVQESSWRCARIVQKVKQLPKSTLHQVDSLLSRQHCISLDIARYRPAKTTSIL